MKKNLVLAFGILIVFGFQISALAQFPIKVPKIKVDKPKEDKTQAQGLHKMYQWFWELQYLADWGVYTWTEKAYLVHLEWRLITTKNLVD